MTQVERDLHIVCDIVPYLFLKWGCSHRISRQYGIEIEYGVVDRIVLSIDIKFVQLFLEDRRITYNIFLPYEWIDVQLIAIALHQDAWEIRGRKETILRENIRDFLLVGKVETFSISQAIISFIGRHDRARHKIITDIEAPVLMQEKTEEWIRSLDTQLFFDEVDMYILIDRRHHRHQMLNRRLGIERIFDLMGEIILF